jgi:hypothetical protein
MTATPSYTPTSDPDIATSTKPILLADLREPGSRDILDDARQAAPADVTLYGWLIALANDRSKSLGYRSEFASNAFKRVEEPASVSHVMSDLMRFKMHSKPHAFGMSGSELTMLDSGKMKRMASSHLGVMDLHCSARHELLDLRRRETELDRVVDVGHVTCSVFG